MENLEFEEIYSKNVIEFITVANEYCILIENEVKFKRIDLISKLQKLLPLLYLKGSLLPIIESLNDDANEKFITEADWNFIYKNLQNKFGRFDEYLEVFDSRMHESDEPVIVTISESLTDIYQDLKDFIMLYRVGTNEIMTDAIWECKANFQEFWGQKLVNTLRAIHNLLYKELIDEEDIDEEKRNDAEENKKSVS